MAKENDKRITLDELATMVANGFDGIGEKMATKEDLHGVGLRLGNVESRLSNVELRMESVVKKVDKLDYQVDEVYDIIKRFEENDILNLQKRVQTLEKAVRALATSQTSR